MIDDKRIRTMLYYEVNAGTYVEDTLSIDISDIQDGFLEHIPDGGHILDAGCGSGRDSLYFLGRGYRITAMDASPALCERATQLIGKKVLCCTFKDFLTDEKYDGIWACSSLLHLELQPLKETIIKFLGFLKPGGVFYMSFKYGQQESIQGERYFTNMTGEKFRSLLQNVEGFEIIAERQTFDARTDRNDEPWFNVLIRKTENR